MPITRDINTKSNIRQKTDSDLLSNLGQPVISVYEEISTAGQLTVPAIGSLPFSIDQNNKLNFVLLIDGRELAEGASKDFTFSQIDQNNLSAKIALNAPLAAGLNIKVKKLGVKKEAELAIDSRFNQIYDATTAGFQGFVDESTKLTAVNGAPSVGQFRTFGIVGRASITDISNDLRARVGIERIFTPQNYEIPNEFGPNGERVYGILNDDRGLIRFVGSWANQNDAQGAHQFTSQTNDYAEVTFYGTGLNVLVFNDAARDLRATVDGGSEGGNILTNNGSWSGALANRNYPVNQVANAASGLAPGIHTVKIRNANSGNNGRIYGFEIVNESSSINIRPGTAYVSNKKMSLSAAQTLAYNSGFESIFVDGTSSGSIGTRGARVLAYLKSDATVGRAAIAVDSTQKNLTAADHSNEEVFRIHYFREFGAGRSDDFSVNSSINRTFVLDDGTTTLQTAMTGGTSPYIAPTSNVDAFKFAESVNDSLSFTFIGTGLDFIRIDNVNTTAASQSYAVTVDGVSIGSISDTVGSGIPRLTKVVSGLPYGTHVVRILRSSSNGSWSMGFNKLIVYGPKKPSLPAGAVELADYNVMATFVANSTQDAYRISTGVLRKDLTREATFVDGTGGTTNWAANSGLGQNNPWYTDFISDRLNSYVQYTFFGTGVDIRSFPSTNRTSSATVSFNGLAATVGNFPTLTASTYGTGSFSTATGIYNQNGTAALGSGLVLSGLPLGLYTIKINNNNSGSSNFLDISTIDVITPIHSPKSNLYGDIQNTLSVGSCAISDNRKISAIKEALPAQKAWAQAIGITNGPTTSSGSLIPIPDMSLTIKTGAGVLDIAYFIATAGSGVNWQSQIFIDGSAVGINRLHEISTSNVTTVSERVLIPVSAGTHKIDVYWQSGSGTITAYQNQRILNVREL